MYLCKTDLNMKIKQQMPPKSSLWKVLHPFNNYTERQRWPHSQKASEMGCHTEEVCAGVREINIQNLFWSGHDVLNSKDEKIFPCCKKQLWGEWRIHRRPWSKVTSFSVLTARMLRSSLRFQRNRFKTLSPIMPQIQIPNVHKSIHFLHFFLVTLSLYFFQSKSVSTWKSCKFNELSDSTGTHLFRRNCYT